MTHILQIDSIELQFNNHRLLADIFMKCHTNEIIGLLGRNGTGKTCLMRIILGNLKATNSYIGFDGVKITNAFKHPDLLMYLPQFHFIPAHLKLSQVFRDFNLDYQHFQNKFPEAGMIQESRVKTLSGGQRRLLEIYVIAKSPARFIMLDEPFTHLNPLQIENVKLFLQDEKGNKGIIITDHMYNHILEISNRVYCLSNGKTHLINNKHELENLGYARIAP